MTIYYLSTKSGSDSNTGKSVDQAWSSFSKLAGKLKPGDSVLLENGSVFDQTLIISKMSGTADKPIIFSNYGTGDYPVLAPSSDKGIHAQQSNYIILENMKVADTGSSGIYGTAANNWIIRNVAFEDTGGAVKNNGAINWWNSSNILIENSSIHNSYGDGVFMNNVNNVTIKDNEFKGASGSNADNIQILGNNAIIEGNILLHNADTNSTKGNLVFQGTNLYAHDNYLQGGSFGISISADNVVVENNVIKDHTKYSWSSDIILSDEITGDLMENIVIKDNILSGSSRNISIDGRHTTAANMDVKNLTISNNELNSWTKAPLAINGANINGVFQGNTTDKAGNTVYATNSDISNLSAHNNNHVAQTQAVDISPVGKTITVIASGSWYQGIAPIMKLLVNGVEVGVQSITALKANGDKQTIKFTIPAFHEGDTFAIKYINDQFNVKTGEDRNLYVHKVFMDGTAITLKSADLSAKVVHQKDGSGMFFSSNASATFTSDDVPQTVLSKILPPEPQWPKLSDILQSNDAHIYYGDENHKIGTTSDQSAYASSFKDLSGSSDYLHQVLSDNFA